LLWPSTKMRLSWLVWATSRSSSGRGRQLLGQLALRHPARWRRGTLRSKAFASRTRHIEVANDCTPYPVAAPGVRRSIHVHLAWPSFGPMDTSSACHPAPPVLPALAMAPHKPLPRGTLTAVALTISAMSTLTSISASFYVGLTYGGPAVCIWGWVGEQHAQTPYPKSAALPAATLSLAPPARAASAALHRTHYLDSAGARSAPPPGALRPR
jgi:hypothetical protein